MATQQTSDTQIDYKISITTGDIKGAGTDAEVFICLFGTKCNTGDVPLPTDKEYFERGQTDVFVVSHEDLGKLYKIRVGHNGIHAGTGWYLEKIAVENSVTKETSSFPCEKWLETSQDDGQIVRDLIAQDMAHKVAVVNYKITVQTGKEVSAGTKSNVFVILHGEKGSTGVRWLKNTQKGLFEIGSEDVFNFQAEDIGPITQITIGHDNSAHVAKGWFLDKVIVKDELRGEYAFHANTWFDERKGDKKIVRDIKPYDEKELLETVYTVNVYTGDVKGAGTSANVSIFLYGTQTDSGERFLSNSPENFQRAAVDTFRIHTAELGELTKIRIQHDNKGFGADWFLDKVVVKNERTSKEYAFPCKQWLSKSTQLSRELLLDQKVSENVTYLVSVRTGTIRGAGTNANVFINIVGANGSTGRKPLEGKNNFERGQTDQFQIESDDLGELQKIEIGHDGTGTGAGWFLQDVAIKNEKSGKQWKFPCGRWLDVAEDDGQIVRELLPGDGEGKGGFLYEVDVVTGTIKGAGTDANVFIEIVGTKGNSGRKSLKGKGNLFEKGQTDHFVIETGDLGELQKIRIGHDNSGFGPGWFLEKVIITAEGKKNFFLCGRWFATDQDDSKIEREIVASSEDGVVTIPLVTYHVDVVTGNRRGAGTDANVSVTVYGEKGDSGVVKLENSNKNLFEKGQTDTFGFTCADLGELQRIRIGHDNSGFGASWFLEKVIIRSGTGNVWYFLCGKWLATDEDDGQIVRELKGSKEDGSASLPFVSYRITTITGDRRGAGTSANVSVTIYGDKGNSGARRLECANNFRRAQTDHFGIETTDLGQLTKIRIGHDNKGLTPGWFLDKVIIESEKTQEKWFFNCGKWLAKDEDDKQIERELPAAKEGADPLPLVNYVISIITGDRRGAGTDADVYITVYGTNGDSGQKFLDNAENNFERGKTDVFPLESVDLGELTKIRIGHNNKGIGAGWFLDKVKIKREDTGKEYYFLCGRWFDKSEEDGLIERELPASNEDGVCTLPVTYYEVTTITGDRRGAGTDANVYVILFGDKGDTGKKMLSKPGNCFERAQSDKFGFEAVELGPIKKILIGHDGSGPGAGWFLDKVVVKSHSLACEWYFLCGRWLANDEDDGKIERELVAQNEDGIASFPSIRYRVAVTTGDRRGAGTDANVFLQVFGENHTTGEIKLTSAKNNFERGQTDIFGFEDIDLGEIKKIRIGHDGSGFGAGWFLDKVVITNMKTSKEWYFLSGRWFDKGEDDGQIIRDISASDKDGVATIPLIKYKVLVTTGDRKGAGTDANVFLIAYGENNKITPKIVLTSPKNNFERGQTDEFGFESEELGILQKIRIGHDNSGFGGSWFLDKVVVTNLTTNQTFYFLSGRWFAKDEDDGQIEREIPASNADGVTYAPLKQYRVAVLTGDRRGAGTDANVYIQVFGTKGETADIHLSSAHDCFERNQRDEFGFEAVDLGELQKLRVYHDNSGLGASWFLDKIIIMDIQANKSWFFLCGRWLAKDMEDGQLERELPASLQDGEASQPVTKYLIIVTTGNVRGAGTDANVYIQLFGEHSDSGRRLLDGPGNLFEKGQVDKFQIESVKLGQLSKILIGHDGTGFGSDWFLESVVIRDLKTQEEWKFACNKWFSPERDDKKIEREINVNSIAGPGATSYKIIVQTGAVKGAGTDANVYLTIEGTTGKIEHEHLENSKENFERGRIDTFGVKSLDLGDLQKVIVSHDGSGVGSGWFLDKIYIINETTKQKWVFPCNRWLDKSADDGKTERVLTPGDIAITTYEIKVKTGDQKNAGTDANVHMYIVGPKGKTEKLPLKYSLTYTDKFERGHVDVFNLEALDVGDIDKIIIGHDNSGIFGASWFLESVEMTNHGSLSDSYYFLCDNWIDKNNKERELTGTKIARGTSKLQDHKFEDDKSGKPAPVQTQASQSNLNQNQATQSPAQSPAPSPAVPIKNAGVATPPPKFEGGKLTLQLLQGRNLAVKDSNGFSDPYCVMTLLDAKGQPIKATQKKSKVIKKNLDPEWNETFQWNTDPTITGIEITVWDEDLMSDEFMGLATVTTTQFFSGKPEILVLEPRKGKKDDEVRGDIVVKLSIAK